MKQKNQVVLNLQGLSVPDKIEKAKSFIKAITGNANFPTPGDLLVKTGAVADKLQNSYTDALEARSISVTKTAIMNQDEAEFDSEVTALGRYIEGASKGDEAKIKSAGMDIKAAAAPIGTPQRPESIKATEGLKNGSVDLKWKAVRGARSYVVRITATVADASSWKQVLVVTKAAATIEGLTSGTLYWFQVAAVGAAGQGPWSDPATKVAP
jgi:Fibronectin type III domain